MPENITGFKRLLISHLDDQVLDFLNKIRSLFTNVVLGMEFMGENAVTLFTHLLPLIASIREIRCDQSCVELLEQHFPGTLAHAKELELNLIGIRTTYTPSCLNWLNAPQNTDVDGPRFLKIKAFSKTIFAIVEAVRQHFMAATTSSTFVVFLEFYGHAYPTDKINLQNATTKEQLTVRDAVFKIPKQFEWIRYVQILRHPIGAEAKMREWIEQRAYYEKKHKEAERMIWIAWPTIGRITKHKQAKILTEHQPVGKEDKAGPSTSSRK